MGQGHSADVDGGSTLTHDAEGEEVIQQLGGRDGNVEALLHNPGTDPNCKLCRDGGHRSNVLDDGRWQRSISSMGLPTRRTVEPEIEGDDVFEGGSYEDSWGEEDGERGGDANYWKSKGERNRISAEKWKKLNRELLPKLCGMRPGADARAVAVREATKKDLLVLAEVSRCPMCDSSDLRCCGEGKTGVDVCYFSATHEFALKIPLYDCEKCEWIGCAGPADLFCFPGTPGAMHPESGRNPEEMPVWFDWNMIRSVETLSFLAKSLGQESILMWIRRVHVDNQCEPIIKDKTLYEMWLGCQPEAAFCLFMMGLMASHGVLDYDTGVAPTCPGCWFCGKPDPDGSGILGELLHYMLDGNFKLVHNISAGSASKEYDLPPRIVNLFVPDIKRPAEAYGYIREELKEYETVRDFCDQQDGERFTVDAAAEKACSSALQADDADMTLGPQKNRAAKYDKNGVMIGVCRHGHVLLMVNMTTAERHLYGVYMVAALWKLFNITINFLWYDISEYPSTATIYSHRRISSTDL
jgi:hypothetical protein